MDYTLMLYCLRCYSIYIIIHLNLVVNNIILFQDDFKREAFIKVKNKQK